LELDFVIAGDRKPTWKYYRPVRHSSGCRVKVEACQGSAVAELGVFQTHKDVVDADLADYFRSIPHADLLKSVPRRIVDRRVLPWYSPRHLCGRSWLGYRPSKKSIKRMVEKVHALTDRAGTWQETTRLVDQLNLALR